MIYYKKHTSTRCIEYKEALEEALCFGWIDSIVKRIDDERYVRKFTPRTNIYNWSDVNKKLVLSLIEKGLMTEAGLRKIGVWLKTGRINWDPGARKTGIRDRELQVPERFLKGIHGFLPKFRIIRRGFLHPVETVGPAEHGRQGFITGHPLTEPFAKILYLFLTFGQVQKKLPPELIEIAVHFSISLLPDRAGIAPAPGNPCRNGYGGRRRNADRLQDSRAWPQQRMLSRC